jgi:hypothetical protein
MCDGHEKDDEFQHWLIAMDEALSRLFQSVPADLAASLDYSAQSLADLEAFVLERYPTIDRIKQQSEAPRVDGLARYVGEVFRKHFGGAWSIDVSDARNAFHGLPQLRGMAGQTAQICPLALVTASTDRRTGKHIRGVFDRMHENSSL